ncbi:MAG: radical SAM protein [Patescibacteria group bacterium]
MKRVVLVNPPSPFLMEQRVFPNLGLIQLVTSLRFQGQQVDLLDLCGVADPDNQLRDAAENYDFIGFSSTTPQFGEAFRLNQVVRETNPQAKTIIGGPHPSAVSSLVKDGLIGDPNIASLEEFDFIVVGEADDLDLTTLNEKWTQAPPVRNISKLPIPDRSLVDIHSYKYSLKGEPTTTVMSQFGCPYSCSFCCGREMDMYRKVRSKSAERIAEELDYLNEKFGFTSFMWFDDEVNINPLRLAKIADLLEGKGYQHRGFVRADLVTKHPETLDHLVRAGFVEVCSGVESGSQRILDLVEKGTTVEQCIEAAELIHARCLDYKAFAMIGHPSETYVDIQRTIEVLKATRPKSFDIVILTPYPGSKLYNHSVHSTKFPGYDREYKGLYFRTIDFSQKPSFYKGIPGEYTCQVRTDDLSSDELLRIRDEIETELKN